MQTNIFLVAAYVTIQIARQNGVNPTYERTLMKTNIYFIEASFIVLLSLPHARPSLIG